MDIASLPNEILDHIFSYFDISSPKTYEKLLIEPSYDITSAPRADLKSISLVSRKWRNAVLSTLFKYVRLIVTEPKLPTPIFDNPTELFEFIARQDLEATVESFAICIRDKESDKIYPRVHHELFDFSGFWNDVFKYINPFELTLVVHPRILGSLLNLPVHADDSWSFDMPYHILQLKQDAKYSGQQHLSGMGGSEVENARPLDLGLSSAENSSTLPPQTIESDPRLTRRSILFEIRPWTSLLLNEGSFMKAYKTYEFFHRRPPSILPWLVGDDEIPAIPVISSTIREFSYIAMFPISEYFCKLTQNFPRLDKLYVQLVPRGDVFAEPEQVEYLDPNDLWAERNTCYAFIMREIFSHPPNGNFLFLKEFESGDAADLDAWHMAVEYVKRAGGGWRVEREGVFVKDDESNDVDEDSDTPPQRSILSVTSNEN